eukprot:760508-Hanusia_phi.AAC.4
MLTCYGISSARARATGPLSARPSPSDEGGRGGIQPSLPDEVAHPSKVCLAREVHELLDGVEVVDGDAPWQARVEPVVVLPQDQPHVHIHVDRRRVIEHV